MMNPMLLMQAIRNSNNPMMFLQQQLGNNPMFQRAMQMAQGKTPEQMAQLMRNLAQQRGMNEQQLSQFLGQFGLHI